MLNGSPYRSLGTWSVCRLTKRIDPTTFVAQSGYTAFVMIECATKNSISMTRVILYPLLPILLYSLSVSPKNTLVSDDRGL